MSARLIAAMASRREKQALHLHRITIVPGGSERELIEESAGTVRRGDRVVGWLCGIGLVAAFVWGVAEKMGWV